MKKKEIINLSHEINAKHENQLIQLEKIYKVKNSKYISLMTRSKTSTEDIKGYTRAKRVDIELIHNNYYLCTYELTKRFFTIFPYQLVVVQKDSRKLTLKELKKIHDKFESYERNELKVSTRLSKYNNMQNSIEIYYFDEALGVVLYIESYHFEVVK